MSIYAGIPSGAYNSEAAMLYGGLAPQDFDFNTVFNLLIPWFTRNNIEQPDADTIAHEVDDYLEAAAQWRLNRDSAGLVAYWQKFTDLAPPLQDLIRKAVNYIRHKKRPSLATTSAKLAEAKNWDEALPYLRALPGIGKRFPRSVLPWLRLPDDVKQLRRTRWQNQIGTPDPMNLDPPAKMNLIAPTAYQLAALNRRRKMADEFAEARRAVLRNNPPLERPKKQYSPDLLKLKQLARQHALDRQLAALKMVYPQATMETMGKLY